MHYFYIVLYYATLMHLCVIMFLSFTKGWQEGERVKMYKRFCINCIRTAILALSMMVLIGCQKNEGMRQENIIQEDSATGSLAIEDKEDCTLEELFDYLSEEGTGIPYAYAQILISVSDAEEEETEEVSEASYSEFRQDIVEMEGVADVSWQTFQTADEFQEYFSMREKEESILSGKAGEYVIEFAYYQYQLEEDTHAVDIDRFLKECYDEEDNPLYAITINEKRQPRSYCFSQSEKREMVVMEHVLYGLECKGTADKITGEDISGLLMAYSTRKQKVKEYSGWVMNEEELYWVDHDERITEQENPTRVFTEVKGIDSTWEGTVFMEYFALFKEADYQIKVEEDGPLLQLHFKFAEDIPPNGYETYLSNGFCSDGDYEMTVRNLDTDELLQSQIVELSIEMPDMIAFVDLDEDGYLDMQIGKPTHSSGERAVMDKYAKQSFMLWNPEEEVFETKSEREVAESLRQKQGEKDGQEETEFVEYVVQSGDTLWGISRRFYGTGTRFMEIAQSNAEVLSKDKYLMPGMVLKIQAPVRLP